MGHDPDSPTIPLSQNPGLSDPQLDDDGTLESRYAAGERLGIGGMGEVTLYQDRRIGREVALKVARRERDSTPSLRAEFLHEARIQAQLEHPSIVPVYDMGLDGSGTPYFTMKRIHGVTLRRLLARKRAGEGDDGRYSRRRLLTAFASICMTVHYAHTRGVVHRDLKPPNIMLGEYGELYVLDWGLARVASMPDDTTHDGLVGTPGYVAPEQIRGGSVDARADVYSLGAILFEILTLEALHRGSEAALVTSTLASVDARASVRAPTLDVPPELDAICVKATALERADRYPSALALHDAVDRFLEGDRDLERRKTLSASHGRAARELAERALIMTDGKAEARGRSEAMGQVNRALALDPENADARRVLLRLLTQPARELPSDARLELERHWETQGQQAARGGAWLFLGWFLWIPIALWLGVHGKWWIGIATVLFVVAAWALFHMAKMPLAQARGTNVALVLTSVALASTCEFASPFILVPSLLMVNAVGFLLQPAGARRAAIVVTSCLAFLAPLVLEWARLVPPSYVLDRGRMIIMNRFYDLTPASIGALTVLTLALLVATSFYFIHLRDEMAESEEKLFMYTWQLRQLVPADATYGYELELNHHSTPAPT
jgi:hypothetical protein